MRIAKTRRAWRKLTGAARRARCAADLLDEVVNARSASLPGLPEGVRRCAADQLAELAMLAQDYRYFAAGWVSDRELRRRGEATLVHLELIKSLPAEQLIERE